MNTEPITIERTFNAPVSRVCKALTDKDDMRQWYISLDSFKAEVGFEFQFLDGGEEKKYLHLCKVTDVITGKKITYSWRYDGYPGNSFVTFELFEEGEKTRLRLTHTSAETFAPIGTGFSAENHKEGWTYLIGKSLNNFLEAK